MAVDGKGKRYNKGKLRVDLVPTSSIRALAEVLTFGAEKYDERNWERGMAWSTVYASLTRHLLAWYEGEENDPESELPHLYHAICNLAFLIEYSKTCPKLDDRPVKRELPTMPEFLK